MKLAEAIPIYKKMREAIRNASPEQRAKWDEESAAIAAKVPPPTAHDLAHAKLRQMRRDSVPLEYQR